MKQSIYSFDTIKEFEIFLKECTCQHIKLLSKSSMTNVYKFIKSKCYIKNINVRIAEYEIPSNKSESIIIKQIIDIYVDDYKEGLYYC